MDKGDRHRESHVGIISKQSPTRQRKARVTSVFGVWGSRNQRAFTGGAYFIGGQRACKVLTKDGPRFLIDFVPNALLVTADTWRYHFQAERTKPAFPSTVHRLFGSGGDGGRPQDGALAGAGSGRCLCAPGAAVPRRMRPKRRTDRSIAAAARSPPPRPANCTANRRLMGGEWASAGRQLQCPATRAARAPDAAVWSRAEGSES